jgi:hypothetical protein
MSGLHKNEHKEGDEETELNQSFDGTCLAAGFGDGTDQQGDNQ